MKQINYGNVSVTSLEFGVWSLAIRVWRSQFGVGYNQLNS